MKVMGRRRQSNFDLPPRMHEKSGTFYYVTTDKPRRWISLGKDMNQARAKWAEIENKPCGADSISMLIDRWLESADFKERPDSTQMVYRSAAKQLKAVFRDTPVQAIQPMHIAEWMDNHHSKHQANMGKAVLSNVMKIAVRHGKITRNPTAEIEKHRVKGRNRYITDEEFVLIRGKANPVLRVAMDIAYLTSSRISDVLAIRLQHITPEGLLVRQIKTKALQLYRMTPELASAIAEAKKIPRKVRSLFLLSTNYGTKYATSTVREWWSEAREAAGVIDAHFHDIRGKSATDAEDAGQDHQKLLGHKSKAMSDAYLKKEKPLLVEPLRKVL